MDPSRWKRVREILETVLEASPEERDAVLRALEKEDAEVASEVAKLLRSEEDTQTFLESETPSASWKGEEAPGAVLDDYELIEEIGEGGFGVVWRATQHRPVRRDVAIKILKPGVDTRQVVSRFEAERQVLALMSHPHIATVHDAGSTPSGRPYFVMEYVPGLPMTEYCDRERLSTHDRLLLFIEVASAIQHAHQKGIIHRDLKASNILVSRQEGRAFPKVIDFGIAKAIDETASQFSLQTEGALVLGTPSSMAPEQADGATVDVDTRADIYSMGVLLYEILTGTPPFAANLLREKGWAEMVRQIKEVDPPTPSSKWSGIEERSATAIANHRRVEPRVLARLLRGDLDRIVMKALEKDRARRYATAEAFAEDIERYLRNEPVLARAPTTGYRLLKYVRRHRLAVSAAFLLSASIVVGFVTTFMFYRQAVRNEEKALNNLDLAEANEAAAEEAATRAAYQARRALSLATIKRLQELRRQAEDDLWPRRPWKIGAFESWLQATAAETAKLPIYREYLDRFDQEADLFEDPSEKDWLRENLQRMVFDLEALDQGPLIANVRGRLSLAQSITELTVDDYEDAWEFAADELEENSAYEGIALEPIVGLIPLEPDPESGFLEFLLAETGEAPDRDEETGRYVVTAEMGLVLVLFPGGTFSMGASSDRHSIQYDERALADEGPVHEVTVAPFLISKYEVTQAQWERVMDGENPSYFQKDRIVDQPEDPGALPVENLSWELAADFVIRLGLELPTEAQWEYAARSGTHTVYHTGDDVHSLAGYANIADEGSKNTTPGTTWAFEKGFFDGFSLTAPVGILLPSPWGLHDVHGNVSEWCRDRRASYDRLANPGDGLRDDPTTDRRLSRGGSFNDTGFFVRCALRNVRLPDNRFPDLGVRPVMMLPGQ